MRGRRWTRGLAVSALAMGLAACGGSGGDAPDTEAPAADAAVEVETAATEVAVLDNGMTVAEQIEARQAQYEALGDTFRGLNQQLRSDSPDVAVIQDAVAGIPEIIDGMETWFPEGTGPDSGVETEALNTIWEQPDDFAQKIADHKAAVATLVETSAGGDLTAIGEAVRATGATCGACHDVYRLDD